MKSNRVILVLCLLALLICGFVSISKASEGVGVCKTLFPGDGCENGACSQFSTAGNCIIVNCWCYAEMKYVDHDCNTGLDDPECES